MRAGLAEPRWSLSDNEGRREDFFGILVDMPGRRADSAYMTTKDIDPDILTILRRWADEEGPSKNAAILRTAAAEIDSLRSRIRSTSCRFHPGKPAQSGGLCWACVKAKQRRRGTA